MSIGLTHRHLRYTLQTVKSTRKFKLYRHKRTWRLHRQINVGGEIWNKCISLHKRYYAQYGKHLNYYLLKKYITLLKARPAFRVLAPRLRLAPIGASGRGAGR